MQRAKTLPPFSHRAMVRVTFERNILQTNVGIHVDWEKILLLVWLIGGSKHVQHTKNDRLIFTRLEFGPQRFFSLNYILCLVSGKQRDPKKAQKRKTKKRGATSGEVSEDPSNSQETLHKERMPKPLLDSTVLCYLQPIGTKPSCLGCPQIPLRLRTFSG